MASPDTIILLIVDYHAAIGGKTPVPPLRTPLVNNLPRVALDSAAAGIRTRDLLIANPTP